MKKEEIIIDFDLFEDFRNEEFLNKCYSGGDIHGSFEFEDLGILGFYESEKEKTGIVERCSRAFESKKNNISNIRREIMDIDDQIIKLQNKIEGLKNQIKECEGVIFKFKSLENEIRKVSEIITIRKGGYTFAERSLVEHILHIPEYAEKFDSLKYGESFKIILPNKSKISKKDFLILYNLYESEEENKDNAIITIEKLNIIINNIISDIEELRCKKIKLKHNIKQISNAMNFIGARKSKSSKFDHYYDQTEPSDILYTIETFGVIKGCKL